MEQVKVVPHLFICGQKQDGTQILLIYSLSHSRRASSFTTAFH